jgi:glutamine amidotransferase-like uncharacterized protein
MIMKFRIQGLAAFLLLLAILFTGPHAISADSFHVGVYFRGTEARLAYKDFVSAFLIDPEITVSLVTAADVAAGKLVHFDVFAVMDFGLQNEKTTPVDFGDLGKAKIKEYVKNGGAYLGIGMGAKLGLKEIEGGFGFVDASWVSFPQDQRGIFKIKLNTEFDESFPELENKKDSYALFDTYAASFKTAQAENVFITFDSDIIPELNAFAALIKSDYGLGKVVLTSWRIHKTPGMKWVLPRLVRLMSNDEILNYSRYLRTDFYSGEKIFTGDMRTKRNNLINTLKSAMAAVTDSQVAQIVSAMRELSEGRYMDFLPHIIGRLRSHHPDVRKTAAIILGEWQYYAAERDFWIAIQNEEDLSILKMLITIYDDLSLGQRSWRKNWKEESRPIKVVVYDDFGVGALDNGVALTQTLQIIDHEIESVSIDAADIGSRLLDSADVAVFPGGSGSAIGSFLGASGLRQIKDFVQNGGGYLGYCASAYLGTGTYDWSLGLLDVASYDRTHWNRGGAIAEVRREAVALKIFPELEGQSSVFMKFWQGPLMVKGNFGNPDYETMLTFLSDVHHRQPEAKGIMPGTACLVVSKEEGKTRVALSSSHPEQTPGLRYFAPRLVRWLARKELIPYSNYMNPLKYRTELMYDKAWRKRYDLIVKTLVRNQDPEDMKEAMLKLVDEFENSRWYIPGFLRSYHATLRELAAELIVDLQIFWAKKDIEVAYAAENDASARKAMKKALQFLNPER